MVTAVKLKVVDADGHYFEPPDALPEYIEPHFREQAPRRVVGPDGIERWQGRDWLSEGVGDFAPPLVRREGKARELVGVVGEDESGAIRRKDAQYSQMDPAAYDGVARLPVMDAEGIDAAVLYPTNALAWVPDGAFHLALNRALNDWQADFCKADPRRLYGTVNIIALHDVVAACAEVRRCVREHGFKAVFLRTCLAKETDRWWGDQYDPFWATCQELDVAIGFHPFPGDTMWGSGRYFDLYRPTPERVFMRGPFTNPVDAMNTVLGLIAGGIPERFPGLRFGILESSGGWLVSFLERMDGRFELLRHTLPHLKLKPSDYFRRQFWISFDPEEAALPLTAEWLGADRIIWGSDYPHPDAFYPGFVTMLNGNIAALDPTDQERIRGLNAVEFYKLS
jgi:predicted TIM-barrel fold metal-dependent hydrolase